MFVNFSNHPSEQWPAAQRDAASVYGEITDTPFPSVPADATADEIDAMADECVSRILRKRPGAVMCQGEFTLTFAVVSKLRLNGITAVAACSERKTVEITENGTTRKTAVFDFRQFREYSPYL